MILVAGSLHLDVVVTAPHLPRLDQTVTGQGVHYAFGGKGGNQAVAAARMGARVSMAGAVGQDGFAETLLAALDAAGVDRTQVARLPGASGMSVAIMQADGGYGAVIVSAANLAIDAATIRFPAACGCLILQNEVPEPVNLALARRARAAGLRVILNAAPARPTAPALLALLDLLVVNRGEAADLTGADEASLDIPAAARALRALGPAAVILTLGADGLYGLAETAFAQPGHAVRVVSTHGAGDAFIGALAAEWMRGATLADAAAFGQAAAALHVAAPLDRRAALTAAEARALLR